MCDKICKKASSRLKLLQQIRRNISPHAAEKIYNVMIRPVLFNYYPVYISLGDTAKSRLQSIQDRAQRIVAKDSSVTLDRDSLPQTRRKRASVDVFKSAKWNLHGLAEEHLHGKNTHENGSLLVLPKVRCDSGRKLSLFKERQFTTTYLVTSEMKSTLQIVKGR